MSVNCGTNFGGKPNTGKTRKGKICPNCKGIGKTEYSNCPICGGIGRVNK